MQAVNTSATGRMASAQHKGDRGRPQLRRASRLGGSRPYIGTMGYIFGGYNGIMEKKMETTIMGLYRDYRVLALLGPRDILSTTKGFWVSALNIL